MRREAAQTLQVVGDGVVLVPGWERAELLPEVVLPKISGSLASPRIEEIVEFIIKLGVNHVAWCAISLARLLKEVSNGSAEKRIAADITIEFMVQHHLARTISQNGTPREVSAYSAPFVRLTKLCIDTVLNETTNLPE